MLGLKRIFTVEHTKVAYWLDFGLYALAIAVLAWFLILSGERIGFIYMTVLVLGGVMLWTFLEYILHRFVLHKVEPFKTWHGRHHTRPRALILAPTLLSSGLIVLLIFTPIFFLSGVLFATAFTVGLLIGYFVYALMHHAIHHWPVDWRYLHNKKRSHALHHMQSVPANFGVTSSFWDRIFGSYQKTNCQKTNDATRVR